MEKKHRAPIYPLYALSFHKDRQGNLRFTETSNMNEERTIANTSQYPDIDPGYFGESLSRSELLDESDKNFIKKFMRAYLGY